MERYNNFEVTVFYGNAYRQRTAGELSVKSLDDKKRKRTDSESIYY